MTLGPDRRTTAQHLLATYRATGRLPHISGGDHDSEGGDGNGEGGEGNESGNGDQNNNASSGGEQGGSDTVNGFKPITSQAELDNLIGKRLDRERSKIAKSVREEIESEVRRKEAEQQGDFRKLYEAAQERIKELEGDITARDLTDLRRSIARQHNLPDDALEFVTGEDDESITASVKKLAKLAARASDIDTDSGKPNAGGGGGNRKKQSVLSNWKFDQ